MAAAIKLMKIGKKRYPVYRIVVMEKRYKRNGKYLDKIGFYNPHTEPYTLKIDDKKLDLWITRGAVVSEGTRKLLAKKYNLTKKD